MPNPKFIRLDELLLIPDDQLTESEALELEQLIPLSFDPEYLAHRLQPKPPH